MPTELILFYGFGTLAVLSTGLAKGGFIGMGAIAVPIFSLGTDPVTAAAILLPILLAQDAVSVWAYRRAINLRIVCIAIPGMAFGVLIGFLMANNLNRDFVLGAVGLIALSFGLQRLWIERRPSSITAKKGGIGSGLFWSTISGLTSQIAHVGSPPFQVWVMPQGLGRDELAGTKAITFAILNWIKVPAYILLGEFTLSNLSATASFLPVAILATFVGVWLVKRIEVQRYYTVLYVFMTLLGLKLLFDAVYNSGLAL